MTDSNRPNRLTQLCDEAIRRLGYIIKLIEHVRSQDAASDNAAKWLSAECCHRAYCGAVYEYCLDPLFAELEAMAQREADEVACLGENTGDTEPPQPAA